MRKEAIGPFRDSTWRETLKADCDPKAQLPPLAVIP
jgi:hypothetical protein